jgi:hypothetical protein
VPAIGGFMDDLFILPDMQKRHGFFNNLNDGALELSIDLSESDQVYWLDCDLIALGGI